MSLHLFKAEQGSVSYVFPVEKHVCPQGKNQKSCVKDVISYH